MAVRGLEQDPAKRSTAAIDPSLVLLNGNILTMDKAGRKAEALAIRDGRILALGTNAAIAAMASGRSCQIDLKGMTVVPGLMDTHLHLRDVGTAGYVVDLKAARSVSDAQELIRAFAATKKPGQWIRGTAWHPPSQLSEGRYLSRQEIDRVAPNNPVYLRAIGHTSMANTRAFEALGLDRATPDPANGKFERDSSGEFTGLLIETALRKVERMMPPWSAEEEVEQFEIAQSVLNSHGITSVVAGAISSSEIAALHRIKSCGLATLRVGLMFRPFPPMDNLAWEETIRGNGASSGFGNEWLKFAAIKIVYDGGMTLKTALMREPYPNSAPDWCGFSHQTYERLKELVAICNRYDWRVGVHAVGDKAVDHALDAYELANQEKSIVGRRFILIHASLIRRDQMERAKRLGVRVDFQNVFMWNRASAVSEALGAERAHRAIPAKSLIDVLGIDSLGAGTDYPVNTLNPFVNTYVMVTRRDATGKAYGLNEAISREQALRLYTSAAPHYTFEELEKGTLEEGKFADMAVLSGDPMTVPEQEIKDITAELTIVNGRVVFSGGSFAVAAT